MTAIALPRPIDWPSDKIRKILLGIALMAGLMLGDSTVEPESSLTYQEGGDPGDVTDPGLDVEAASRRYVCSTDGSDSDDGLTQANAWATINKVASQWGSIPSNAIVTLCRGGSWSASTIANKAGTASLPTAIGAYGSCTPYAQFPDICSNAPRITGGLTLNGSSWITVRDISAYQFDTSFGSNNMLMYRNEGKGTAGDGASNVFRVFGGSFKMVFVENVATDATGNDYFVLHDGGGENFHDSAWFISNICMASNAEDCYDLDMAQTESPDPHIAEDVKAIANVGSGSPLSGYSDKTGNGALCFQGNHEGQYHWIIGNICMGWTSGRPFSMGRLSDVNYATEGMNFMQVSGNIFIGEAGSNTARFFTIDQYLSHNTWINGGTSTTVQIRDVNEDIPFANQSFDYNLVYADTGNSNELVDVRSNDSEYITRDNNWYGDGTGRDITNGNLLAAMSPYDTSSDEGDVDGISFPTIVTYPNPLTWWDASFQSDVTPAEPWSGCNGANTPGALDCNGNKLGLEINSMDGGVCGWGGLPIVAVKLAELGIGGNCPGAWDS